MLDKFEGRASSTSGPAMSGFAITPHDTNELEEMTRAVYVGAGGSIALQMHSGANVTLVGVASGTFLPVRVRKVLATGTTAGSIVGLS